MGEGANESYFVEDVEFAPELPAPLPTEPEPSVSIVPLDKFSAVDEEGAAAILGTEDNAAIAAGNDVMLYGDGGSGKTTMGLDLGCHLAAGDDWIGITVPKPVNVLMIENEGPRPRFRRKCRRKLDAWTGSELGGRLYILEQPWGRFNYADPVWRQTLASFVRLLKVDVIVIGPLTASGMEAAGTLQETREFIAYVDDVRALAERHFAQLLIHHENRGGKVSGAWEGTGDTLLHIQQLGHGRLRLSFKKTRWASELHGTSVQLLWAEGERFERAEEEAPRPERVWDDIAAFVLANGGCKWNEVDAAVPGQRDYLTRRRTEMLADGLIVNVARGQRFELWHRDDPARPTIDTTGSGAGTGRESVGSAPGGGGKPGRP